MINIGTLLSLLVSDFIGLSRAPQLQLLDGAVAKWNNPASTPVVRSSQSRGTTSLRTCKPSCVHYFVTHALHSSVAWEFSSQWF